ncbi:MAG: flagellar protein, partial [Lachnospiraceae bacterium]|nr:flagellar protein [Lachnospiraceae bacterium]
MEVKNCRGCGRLFNYLQGPQLCPACIEGMEKKFLQVRDYLETYPNANMNDIAKDNGVSRRQIEQWVKEERLYFAESSPYGIGCEQCGKTIKSGRFCNECRDKMASTLQNALKKPTQ